MEEGTHWERPQFCKLIAVVQNWEEAKLWADCVVSTDYLVLRAASMEKLHLGTQNLS